MCERGVTSGRAETAHWLPRPFLALRSGKSAPGCGACAEAPPRLGPYPHARSSRCRRHLSLPLRFPPPPPAPSLA